MNRSLTFSTSGELIRVPSEAVVLITADGNYSVVTLADGSEYVLTLQLGQIERKLMDFVTSSDNRFIRIGKSLIINREYISFIYPASREHLPTLSSHSYSWLFPSKTDSFQPMPA